MSHCLKRSLFVPGSLDDNQLCGVDKYGDGTFTTKGITALCEGLKQSKVSSLRCVSQICKHL